MILSDEELTQLLLRIPIEIRIMVKSEILSSGISGERYLGRGKGGGEVKTAQISGHTVAIKYMKPSHLVLLEALGSIIGNVLVESYTLPNFLLTYDTRFQDDKSLFIRERFDNTISRKVISLSLIIQGIMAIYTLNSLGYSHEDIHGGNIGISKVVRSRIKYVVGGNEYTVDNQGVQL